MTYTFVYNVTCDSLNGPVVRTVEIERPNLTKPGAADVIQAAEDMYGPQVEILGIRLIEEIENR